MNMAVFSKAALSANHLLVVLVLVHLLCIQSQKFVVADDESIHEACQFEKQPSTCIKCLGSNPCSNQSSFISSTSSEMKILLNVLLDCMSSQASLLQDQLSAARAPFTTSNLNTDSSTTTRVEEAYTDCIALFSSAKSALSAASLCLKYDDFNAASTAAYAALRFHDTCRKAIIQTATTSSEAGEAIYHSNQQYHGTKEGQLPKEMIVEMDAYRNLYAVIDKMVDRAACAGSNGC